MLTFHRCTDPPAPTLEPSYMWPALGWCGYHSDADPVMRPPREYVLDVDDMMGLRKPSAATSTVSFPRANSTSWVYVLSTGMGMASGWGHVDAQPLTSWDVDVHGYGSFLAGVVARMDSGAHIRGVRITDGEGRIVTSSLLDALYRVYEHAGWEGVQHPILLLAFGGWCSEWNCEDDPLESILTDVGRDWLMVAPAGESSGSVCGISPAMASNVISVGRRTRMPQPQDARCPVDVHFPGWQQGPCLAGMPWCAGVETEGEDGSEGSKAWVYHDSTAAIAAAVAGVMSKIGEALAWDRARLVEVLQSEFALRYMW